MYTIEQLQRMIEQSISDLSGKWSLQPPVNLYEPVSYAMAAGGKRLRPTLVLLAYQLFGKEVQKAVPTALAVEVFHNFTLLHDDIMDKAELRRNLPTVHKKYSENTAILSGDAMAFMAYELLLETDLPAKRETMPIFTRTALEVCEGQQLDMDFELRNDVTASEYIEMIRLKTAVLLGCALQMGALLGGATPAQASDLYQVGINMGLAFQLQDDLLDSFGNEETFGKKIGGDIVSNKKTYLLIESREQASGELRSQLDYWISTTHFDSAEKIESVKAIYQQLGVKEKVEAMIGSFTSEAIGLLEALPVEQPLKLPLTDLCNQLARRIS